MGIQPGNVTALEALSPAKINLFLHVTGRQPDGYHSLQTVFQLLDWGDDMRFEHRDQPVITLSGDTDDIPRQDNLIVKAAEALSKGRYGAHIHIRKRLPRGGGLGGGSSNAATTLLALNQLWKLKLPKSTLLELAAPLGADVPVFVLGQNAWAEGTGDVLTPLTLPKRWYVIVQPQCEVSTAEIFAQPELTRHTAPITVQAFFSGAGSNDLQAVVLSRYPEVKQAWEWLYKQSSTACMTGSGACLFAALETREEAEVIAAIAPQGLKVNVAEGLDKLPPMQEVA